MKRQLVLMAFAAVISIASANAQNFQRRTVEERVQSVHVKIDSAFKPEASRMVMIDSIFATYYRATDKAREDMMAAGNTDRDAMRTKMQEMTTERDNKLKTVLTEEQMKIWKETIEPSMRRPRGNGGGNN